MMAMMILSSALMEQIQALEVMLVNLNVINMAAQQMTGVAIQLALQEMLIMMAMQTS